MGQPLYCLAADAGVWGERGFGDGATCYVDSAVITLLPWLPGFPPQAFPTTISSLTSPLSVSLQSTTALDLGLFQYLLTPAPSCCTFQGTCVPVWDMYGCGKDCLILIPFRLPQISCFSLSLKCFSSDSESCPDVGLRRLLQFPPPEGRSSPTNTPVLPPGSFITEFCKVLYILFRWSGTPVRSQLVFCMHFCV